MFMFHAVGRRLADAARRRFKWSTRDFGPEDPVHPQSSGDRLLPIWFDIATIPIFPNASSWWNTT